MLKLFLVLTILFSNIVPVLAEGEDKLSGGVEDRLAEAQEKLITAKGSYKTIKMQEAAIENMRRATKMSLKAAKLRAKAEKLQYKADTLVNKANLSALSRGLYVTNPLAPVMMQPPPEVASKPADSPVTPPVPGEPINVSIPRQEEVTDATLPESPVLNDF